MNLQTISKTFETNGQSVTIETGRLAKQANGSVTVRVGDAVLFCSVCATKDAKEGQSFFPLSVDYQEKFASAGRISGSFFKREARLTGNEILISRLVDRALRPLFPDDYFCEVQVLINLISSDSEVKPDALACLAASAALAVSDIPIQEMISEVRVSKVNGEYVVNPSRSQLKEASMEFIVAASEDNIMMVEGESHECSEEELVEAIGVAHEAIKTQIEVQKALREAAGSPEKHTAYSKPYENEEVKQQLADFASDKIYEVAKGALPKAERQEKLLTIKEAFIESLGEDAEEDDVRVVGKYFHALE